MNDVVEKESDSVRGYGSLVVDTCFFFGRMCCVLVYKEFCSSASGDL